MQCLRLIFNTYDMTKVSITAPFLTILDVEDRIQLSLEDDRWVVIGTDATEWSVAAVYYAVGEGVRVQLPKSVPEAIEAAVAATSGTKTEKGRFLGMAITELLSVVAAMLQWGPTLRGVLVVLVTDNQNVLRWIRKRGARNLFGQALLRLITRLELTARWLPGVVRRC